MRRVESHIQGIRGEVLFTRSWLPEACERALVVVHGYAEHSGRYEHVAAWLADRGCAVHAYDHFGHGRSAGPRGHVRRFDDYLDDLQEVLARSREAHPGLPQFALGHSMGGLILATLLRERAPALTGAVITGAPLARELGLRRRMWLLRVLRHLASRRSIPSQLPPEGLSRDPEVVERYLADPLVFRTMTLSLAVELADAVARTAPGAAEVAVPLLTLHGEADPICPVAAARAFGEQVPVPGSRFRAYPELRHEILNEPERERVLEDILAWIEEIEDPKPKK